MTNIKSKNRLVSLAAMFFLVAAGLFFINGNFNSGIVRAEEMSAPGVPNLVSPADGAALKTNGIVLSWTAGTNSSHLAGYDLKITSSAFGGPSNPIRVAATQYQTSDLPDGTYRWQVRACDTGANCSPWSGQRSFSVDTRALSSPTGITATAILGGKSTISWAAVTGAEFYRVYRDSTRVGETKQTTYTDAGLNPGSYKYYVAALDVAGNESERGGPASVTIAPPPTPTATPTDETGASGTEGTNVTTISTGTTLADESAVADESGQIAGATDEAVAESDNPPADSSPDNSATRAADRIKAQASEFLGQPWWLWALVAVAAGLGVWLVFRRRNK